MQRDIFLNRRLLSPPTKPHRRDVPMRTVHCWGQGSSYLPNQSVLPVTEREGKRKGVFRLKKILTQVGNHVSMFENLGIRALSSQARNRDSGEHNLGLSFSSFDLT